MHFINENGVVIFNANFSFPNTRNARKEDFQLVWYTAVMRKNMIIFCGQLDRTSKKNLRKMLCHTLLSKKKVIVMQKNIFLVSLFLYYIIFFLVVTCVGRYDKRNNKNYK